MCYNRCEKNNKHELKNKKKNIDFTRFTNDVLVMSTDTLKKYK